MRTQAFMASLVLVAGFGGGELTWKKLLGQQAQETSLPDKLRFCPDGTPWLVGPTVLRRDFFGGYTQVEVCGDFTNDANGERRNTDLACLPDGRLVVLCGTEASRGQVLVSYDSAKQGTPVPLPSDGDLHLLPLADTVAIAGESKVLVLENGALREVGEHGLAMDFNTGIALSGAGFSASHLYVAGVPSGAGQGAPPVLRRFDGTTWTDVLTGVDRVERRDGAVFAMTGVAQEFHVLRIDAEGKVDDFSERLPKTVRPVTPIAILPPDRVVYLAYFRSGFEFENPRAYVWIGRSGASDLDYVGAAPFISGGGLYVAGGGDLLGALDSTHVIGRTSTAIYEGVQ